MVVIGDLFSLVTFSKLCIIRTRSESRRVRL